MYLEISSRRSGKTRRLVEAVKRHSADGGYSVVRCINGPIAKMVLEPLLKGVPRVKVLGHWKKGLLKEFPEYDNARWFYDEFDHIDDVEVSHDGYYAGTPRFIRTDLLDKDDVLLRLIEANGMRYHAYLTRFDWMTEAVGYGLPTHELGVFIG